MTIPTIVAIVTLIAWFAASAPAENVPWWRSWLIEVLRITFAASMLVVLWARMTERAF